MIRRLWFILTCVCLASLPMYADQIILKNGDHLSGHVVRLQGGSLLVRTDAMGEVKIKWDAVQKITAESAVHIVAAGAQVKAQEIERGASSDTVVTAGEAAFTLPAGRISAIRSDAEQLTYERSRYRRQNVLDHWNGTLDAGLSAARGNANSTNMSLGLKAERVSDRTRLSLGVTSLLARSRTSDGITLTSANAVRSGIRYEVNVSDRIFTFGFGTFESDRVQHLDLRDVIGGGAGFRITQSERGTLDVYTGASVNQESFSVSDTPDRLTGELLIGQDLAYKLSGRTAFDGRVTFFPNLSVPGEYRAVLDTTASTKLNDWIGWQVTLSNIYVTNPPLGAQRNDLLLSTGIRFSLGHERQFKPRAKVLGLNPPKGF